MKIYIRLVVLTSLITSSVLLSISASASDALSANAALVSQYFFRGIPQTTNASASAGVDYDNGNFSAGIWVADVQDGLEIDFYGSFSHETSSGVTIHTGYTTYQYSGDFDSAYNEINLSLDYGIFSLSYNVGKHEEDLNLAIDEANYDFTSLTMESNGFYVTLGLWGKDVDGRYAEFGYNTEVVGIDLGIALISNSKDLDIDTGTGDESLVLSIKKTF